MNIGNKIMGLRKKQNLSQEELAEKVGVARQTISKWELGETSPDIKQAKDLSIIFNVSLDELVDNDIKDILIEKTSNTEKLAGLILKLIRIIGIGFIVFIVFIIVCYFCLIGIRIERRPEADRTATITCILHDKEYKYEFEFNEESGEILEAGGDGNIANVTDIDKYSNAYQALDIIDAYVANNGGTCTRTDNRK